MRIFEILSLRRLPWIEDKLVTNGMAKAKKPAVTVIDHSLTQTCDKRIVSWKPRQGSHWEYPTHRLNLWCVKLTIQYINCWKFKDTITIIQFQECSNVISACRDVRSVQLRFQRRMDMVLFNFRNNCKHNI